MGTRSLTIIQGDDGSELCTIYKQFDGYPDGLGEQLKEICGGPKGCKITNGIGMDCKPGQSANGMGCLAAQVIAGLKEGLGNVYLYPVGSRDCGEEYRYTLYPGSKSMLRIKAESGYESQWETLYDGPIQDFVTERETADEKN